MRLRHAHGWALASALVTVGFGLPAAALNASEAQGRARTAISSAEADIGKISTALSRAKRRDPSIVERIAAGDMLYRTKDYERSIDEFSKVLELHRQGKAPEAARADALFFLGENYMKTRQYLSARRHYREIVEAAPRSPYDSYAGRSISRLVDVALRTDDLTTLDYIFARLNALPASDASGSLQYARGKALYARKDYPSARAAINSVPAGSEYAHQAQYLMGVILMREAMPAPRPEDAAAAAKQPQDDAALRARFAAPIEQFRRITRMPADTESHRHVIDLAWMAIGRLFYETDNYLDSAEAYSHVDRTSPEFPTMLYELAWVYVRLGDYQRAQRALEVLTIMDPERLEIADGSLLRADLMLRSGQFEKALTLYQSVRGKFDPIREQLDRFLASTNDPAVYYDRLTRDELEAGEEALPPLVVQWAREEAEDERVFSMIDDVTRSRDLIKKSRRLASKLNAVLGSSTRVKAFPEVRAPLEQTLGLINKVARARVTLAEGMDDVHQPSAGELERVRAERRTLMRRMGYLPVTDGDFSGRDSSGDRQWDEVSQKVQGLQLEADRLQAIINGLKRVMKEAEQHGVTKDPSSRQRFQAEIVANERELEGYRTRIQQYRDAMDMGRAQVGFGDQRFVEDDNVRQRFRAVFAREVQLAAAGQGGGSAASYARSIQGTLARADAVEGRLEGIKSGLERDALGRANALQSKIAEEVANMETYAVNLDGLDQQARVLVGEVAMKNFGLVRDRLKSIVLRADTGIVQQAWELREEQRIRVNNLQRERAREEQNLNDELREVLDDAEDSQ
ncbi:MAG TPA: tetratricopeptide repeat protein [Polyangiaceae bacterium]